MDEGIVRVFRSKEQADLHVGIIGKTVYKYDIVESTNDAAFMHGLKGEKEGSVFWARGQTKGRGRLGRRWVSHKDKGLYFSVILRPDMLVKDTPKITLLAALSVAKALRKISGLEFLIKWPNDVVINDKKIAGILTEADTEINRVKFIVLGIGINTNLKSCELPVRDATSLTVNIKKEVNNESLLRVCLKELDSSYLRLKRGSGAGIIDEARNFSSLWGRQVRIEDLVSSVSRKMVGGMIEGTAVDFDEDGSLMIRQNNGFLKHVFAGDVRLLR